MIIFYSPSLDKFDNEETFMFYTSKGMIFINSKNHVARLNEIWKLDETNINEYAISRGFEKVLEVIKIDEDTYNTNWEPDYATSEWKHKTESAVYRLKSNLQSKIKYRVIPDKTVKQCISELSNIKY